VEREKNMSGRAQEDAYFYRIDRELIKELHRSSFPEMASESEKQESAFAAQSDGRRSLADFLDEYLQPNESWLADI
jgi:hypothetical protein